MLARVVSAVANGGSCMVRRLRIPESVRAPDGIPIRPRNLEQQFLMDALLDDSISVVTCFGKAFIHCYSF
jgi:PhoH-like ATPase